MAILLNSGRTALAVAVKNSVLHLAWGRGASWWDERRNDSLTFVDGGISLARVPFAELAITSQDEATTYVADTDYTVNSLAGTVTRLPGGSIPAGATVRAAYRTPHPAELPTAIGLVDEIARKLATSVRFVAPDVAGAIEMPGGSRYSISEAPTPHLLVETVFAYAEGANETIREVGVVMNTTKKDGVPPGKLYLEPAEVDDRGIMLVVQNINPILRNGGTQQSFGTVLTF